MYEKGTESSGSLLLACAVTQRFGFFFSQLGKLLDSSLDEPLSRAQLATIFSHFRSFRSNPPSIFPTQLTASPSTLHRPSFPRPFKIWHPLITSSHHTHANPPLPQSTSIFTCKIHRRISIAEPLIHMPNCVYNITLTLYCPIA